MELVAVEPIVRGNEHAHLNAGLLCTLAEAVPSVRITFVAEENHYKAVADFLRRANGPVVAYKALSDWVDEAKSSRSLFEEYALCNSAIRETLKLGCKTLVFSAVNGPQLLSLKTLLRVHRLGPGKLRVCAVAHSILQSIVQRPPRRPWKRVVWFRNALRWGNLPNLKVIAPGKTILERALGELPGISGHLEELDITYLFLNTTLPSVLSPQESAHFAFVGVGTRRKGIDAFFRLAREVRRANSGAQSAPTFSVIGPVFDKVLRESGSSDVVVSGDDQLWPQAEFEDRIRKVHYVVLLHDPREYELVASGAFLDALASVKPVIALKSAYFERQFALMGDIGYLCSSLDEVRSTVLRIASHPPVERYAAQCQNILEGRYRFGPAYLAERARESLEVS